MLSPFLLHLLLLLCVLSSADGAVFARKILRNPGDQEGENVLFLCYLDTHSAARWDSLVVHADREYHSHCPGDESHDLCCFAPIMNICWCTSMWAQMHRALPRTLTHKHAQRHRRLVPLLVTCNYVAMMSLIFCIGWKRRDAEWLESAGKCLAVWNTNMLICEQWLKGKCFSMPPPANVYLNRVETERKAGWLTGRLTQPWWTRRILAARQASGPALGPQVDRGRGGRENKQW